MKMKKYIPIILIIIMVIGAVVLVKKRKSAQANLPTPKAMQITVEVKKPKLMTVEQTREFVGKYYSINKPVISSKLSGYIKEVHVKEGDMVSKGDLLIKIDDKDIIASVNAQKSSIKAAKESLIALEISLKSLASDYLYAKSVYERNLELFKVDAISKENLDLSKVNMEFKLSKFLSTKKSIKAKQEELKSMKYQLKSKESLIKYAQITSPIDGKIGKILFKKGDLAAPNKPLLTVYGKGKRIEFNFPTDLFNIIQEGREVKILDTKAHITRVLPSTANALAIAYVDLKEPLPLPDDSNIKLNVITKKVEGIAIPLNAILSESDSNSVFIYKDNKFFNKKINILAKDNRYAVISDNISEPVAIGSNDKLSTLFLVKNVKATLDEK
jgi:RND family efflux transporter MFP subunit